MSKIETLRQQLMVEIGSALTPLGVPYGMLLADGDCGRIADHLLASPIMDRIRDEARCPSISPSDKPCIGMAEPWHEIHADRVGSTWRNYAAKVPGVAHNRPRT